MSLCRVFGRVLTSTAATFSLYAQQAKPAIKHTSCLEADARGNGPAASALNSKPADLTMLAKSNGGKFPADRVMSILRGEASVTARGNRDMPVWGRSSGSGATAILQSCSSASST